jgi:hypothetical protein
MMEGKAIENSLAWSACVKVKQALAVAQTQLSLSRRILPPVPRYKGILSFWLQRLTTQNEKLCLKYRG